MRWVMDVTWRDSDGDMERELGRVRSWVGCELARLEAWL